MQVYQEFPKSTAYFYSLLQGTFFCLNGVFYDSVSDQGSLPGTFFSSNHEIFQLYFLFIVMYFGVS